MADLALAVQASEVAIADYMAVRAGEDVLITIDHDTDLALIEVIGAMVRRAGARLHVLSGARLPFQGQLADPFVSPLLASAMKQCDVWIDLAFPYYAGCHAYDEAIKAGRVRYLLMGDQKLDAFCRLFGLVDLDDYFAAQDAFDNVFGGAEGARCRITTPDGTDLSFELGPKSEFRKPRRAETPGMYLVPGACTIPAKIQTARGQVVVLASFHEFYERLAAPVTLAVDGVITGLSGGGASRVPLERAMRRASGASGGLGSIIHYTHGIHPAARFTGTSFIEDMRAVGHNAIGLGIPWWLPGGGENHPDAVLSEQSVWIGEDKLIDGGSIIGPPALRKRIERLIPLDRLPTAPPGRASPKA